MQRFYGEIMSLQASLRYVTIRNGSDPNSLLMTLRVEERSFSGSSFFIIVSWCPFLYRDGDNEMCLKRPLREPDLGQKGAGRRWGRGEESFK